jgi:hypothetical protein
VGLNKKAVTIPAGPVPDYLLPDSIRKQKKIEETSKVTKILVHTNTKDIEKLK